MLLMSARTRIGKFSRVSYLARIRRKVPFDLTRAKPARQCNHRSLAITQTLYPGPFLLLTWFLSPSTPTYVLVSNLQTLRAA